MRQGIAISSLCSLLALAGCHSYAERMASPPAVTHSDDGTQAIVRASSPQDPSTRPPQVSSLGAPDGARQVERADPLPPASSAGAPPRPSDAPSAGPPPRPSDAPPGPSQPPPGGVAPVPAPPAASLPQEVAPSAEEIAQVLKEDEDALATLPTAGRALEVSHRKLEELLRRQTPQPPPVVPPPVVPPSVVPVAPQPVVPLDPPSPLPALRTLPSPDRSAPPKD